MNTELQKMTNKELEAYCQRNSINIDSKNVSKPTKAELLAAIEAAGDLMEESTIKNEGLDEYGMDDVEDFLNTEPEELTVESFKPKTAEEKKLTRAQKRIKQRDELMPLRRVLITNNNSSQTTIKTQVHYSTWGNRLLGHHTDRFVCDSAWHVREGCLRNLESMVLNIPVQDDEGNTVRFETKQAYVVQRLAPLTVAERSTIGKRQQVREASIEESI